MSRGLPKLYKLFARWRVEKGWRSRSKLFRSVEAAQEWVAAQPWTEYQAHVVDPLDRLLWVQSLQEMTLHLEHPRYSATMRLEEP